MAGGRPTVMTDEVVQKLEQAFLVGATDREACCAANIAPSTLYDYCTANPKFSERKETLKDRPTLKAKMIIGKALDGEDLPTAHKVIDRQVGQKIDVTTGGEKISNNFQIMPVTTRKDDE